VTETVTVGSGGNQAENRANQRDELRQRPLSTEKAFFSRPRKVIRSAPHPPSLGVGVVILYPLENFQVKARSAAAERGWGRALQKIFVQTKLFHLRHMVMTRIIRRIFPAF
jgi:hypothetical protein